MNAAADLMCQALLTLEQHVRCGHDDHAMMRHCCAQVMRTDSARQHDHPSSRVLGSAPANLPSGTAGPSPASPFQVCTPFPGGWPACTGRCIVVDAGAHLSPRNTRCTAMMHSLIAQRCGSSLSCTSCLSRHDIALSIIFACSSRSAEHAPACICSRFRCCQPLKVGAWQAEDSMQRLDSASDRAAGTDRSSPGSGGPTQAHPGLATAVAGPASPPPGSSAMQVCLHRLEPAARLEICACCADISCRHAGCCHVPSLPQHMDAHVFSLHLRGRRGCMHQHAFTHGTGWHCIAMDALTGSWQPYNAVS